MTADLQRLSSGRTKGEGMQRIRWHAITLLSTALSFMPSTAGAVSRHGNPKTVTQVLLASSYNVVGFLAQFFVPVSEPTGLIIMGLLLIGLSAVVGRGVLGKRNR